MNKWKPAEYKIVTNRFDNSGKPLMILVKGETKGFFGIHGTSFNYGITHLPTGYSLNGLIPDGMKRIKKNLRVLVDKLKVLDWDFTDPKQAEKLKFKCKELVNLIKLEDIK